jgi:hypothetical protein
LNGAAVAMDTILTIGCRPNASCEESNEHAVR